MNLCLLHQMLGRGITATCVLCIMEGLLALRYVKHKEFCTSVAVVHCSCTCVCVIPVVATVDTCAYCSYVYHWMPTVAMCIIGCLL